MRIGIDARFYGPAHAGLGRYTKNLVDRLTDIDQTNDYAIFLRGDNIDAFQTDNPRFQKVLAEVSHYSMREQLVMPRLLDQQRLDLVHFPHLNVPLRYSGRYVVTIHDLIMHTFKNRSATTKMSALYEAKHAAYRLVTRRAAERSAHILAPSQAVKDELVDFYHLTAGKVSVTHEAADDLRQVAGVRNQESDQAVLRRYGIESPYIIYVGNVYPHKNIELLAKSMAELHQRYGIRLILPSSRSVFLERTEAMMRDHGVQDWVVMPGFVPDEDLQVLYAHGLAYVFPTLAEGFGLPPLEAMTVGLPVVCSNIPVLKEVCGQAALYFNPYDPQTLIDQVGQLVDRSDLRQQMITLGHQRAGQFSWTTMAEQTLAVYRQVGASI